jgi:hypothetical protein
VCCGTKRLVQIRCPADCAYLASAREHPAAASVRRQQRDIAFVTQFVRDFSERQSRLFLLITGFIVEGDRSAREGDRFTRDISEPVPMIQPLIDDDVAEAAAALAATFETASRGVIYEHRPASLPGERLMTALKPLLAEAGKAQGSSFERDAAVVLRRIEQAVRDVRGQDPENHRAFLDLIGRVVVKRPDAPDPDAHPSSDPPRLIVP